LFDSNLFIESHDLYLIDFFVGVDANDGVRHVVRDLVKVTPNRAGLEDLKELIIFE
jgi:hypothetical protein